MTLKKILIVDDEPLIRWVLTQALNDWGFMPIEAANAQAALKLFDSEQPALTILDINLAGKSGLEVLQKIRQNKPNAVVILITADLLIENAINALRAGAHDFITKPINLTELQMSITNGLRILDSHPDLNGSSASHKSSNGFAFEKIIGESAVMKELVSLSKKISKSNASTILLQGESGTGKDLFAKAIHDSSVRCDKPFIAINCAAIPATLIESELFGHEKGSFTDAKTSKEGLFEQAKGGTIFLDEIGELELSLQAKLLRVLEEETFRRVGGLKNIPLNACVIAASNRNLQEQSRIGVFRLDLYYRLSVIEINIPPLRARGDDVILIANHFIKILDKPSKHFERRQLSAEVIEAFRRYSWAGNVRELRNIIERALILEDSNQITLKYLPLCLRQPNSLPSSNFIERRKSFNSNLPVGGISLEEIEDSFIDQALTLSNGNVTHASKLLNITRDQLRYRLKKKKLEKEK